MIVALYYRCVRPGPGRAIRWVRSGQAIIQYTDGPCVLGDSKIMKGQKGQYISQGNKTMSKLIMPEIN